MELLFHPAQSSKMIQTPWVWRYLDTLKALSAGVWGWNTDPHKVFGRPGSWLMNKNSLLEKTILYVGIYNQQFHPGLFFKWFLTSRVLFHGWWKKISCSRKLEKNGCYRTPFAHLLNIYLGPGPWTKWLTYKATRHFLSKSKPHS